MKKRMKRGIILMLICSFITGLSSCAGDGAKPNKQEETAGNYADSPDALIEELVKRVKSKDIAEITKLFALEEYEDELDSTVEGIEGLTPMTVEERKQEIGEYISMLYFALNFEDPDQMMEYAQTQPEPDQVLDMMSTGDYSDLEIVRIDLPESEEKHNERVARVPSTIRWYGADGWDYRVALLSMNGHTYVCGFEFAVYDGRYTFRSLECPMAYVTSILPCTEEDYMDIIESENE